MPRAGLNTIHNAYFFPACYKFSTGVISGPTRGIPAHPAGKRVRSLITGRVSNDLWKDEDQ